jgi:putative heme-binding domain-containing protein
LYFRLHTLEPQQVLLGLQSAAPMRVWHNGRPLQDAEPRVVALEPGSNDLLVRVAHGVQPVSVRAELKHLARLEVALPEKLAPSSLAERLKHASAESATSLPAEFLGVDWTETARTGNAEHGRRLFSADGLGCAKCHAIMPHQKGGGGPSLAGALGRLTVSHVVESVLLPSKQVAPVFGTTTIVTAEGQTFAGLVVEENDQQVVLLLPTAVHQSVAKRGIEGRQLQAVSPMPSGLVKTPDELRDLLAYLLSPNPLAP